jgi:hypothetical protein
MLKSKTKSVQTECSSQKMSTGLQAEPPKNQEVQTMQDRTFNVPSLQNYIYGLHRRTDDKQFVFTLTRSDHK